MRNGNKVVKSHRSHISHKETRKRGWTRRIPLAILRLIGRSNNE